jgi:hypothetical protein
MSCLPVCNNTRTLDKLSLRYILEDSVRRGHTFRCWLKYGNNDWPIYIYACIRVWLAKCLSVRKVVRRENADGTQTHFLNRTENTFFEQNSKHIFWTELKHVFWTELEHNLRTELKHILWTELKHIFEDNSKHILWTELKHTLLTELKHNLRTELKHILWTEHSAR